MGRDNRWLAPAIYWAGALQLIAILFLIPSDHVTEYGQGERTRVASVLGAESEQRITQRADMWFDMLFVRTNIYPWIHEFLFDRYTTDTEVGGSFDDRGTSDWIEERFESVWLSVYMSMYRVGTILFWVPFIALILIPAMIDGWSEREKRKWRFIFSSPGVHASSKTIYWLLGMGLLALIMFPIRVDVMVYPIIMLIATMVGWSMIINLSKRI